MNSPRSFRWTIFDRVLLYSTIPALLMAMTLAGQKLEAAEPLPELVAQAGPVSVLPGGDEDGLGHLRYGESVSLNDRCPRLKAKLNPGVRPLYVNGFPVGFC